MLHPRPPSLALWRHPPVFVGRRSNQKREGLTEYRLRSRRTSGKISHMSERSYFHTIARYKWSRGAGSVSFNLLCLCQRQQQLEGGDRRGRGLIVALSSRPLLPSHLLHHSHADLCGACQ